jgi:hypothetical protein
MSRQNNNQRERKMERPVRDAASNTDRHTRNGKDSRPDANREKDNTRHVNGLNKYGLNDLYERSSI